MRTPVLAVCDLKMARNEPTNGRKLPTGEGDQLTLWPGVSPVTAHDLAVWVYGVGHKRPGERGFIDHCRSFGYVDRIAIAKTEPERWRTYEESARRRTSHEFGIPADIAMKISADIMLAYLAELRAPHSGAVNHRSTTLRRDNNSPQRKK